MESRFWSTFKLFEISILVQFEQMDQKRDSKSSWLINHVIDKPFKISPLIHFHYFELDQKQNFEQIWLDQKQNDMHIRHVTDS